MPFTTELHGPAGWRIRPHTAGGSYIAVYGCDPGGNVVVILSAEMPRARYGRRLEKGGSDADININVRATPRRTSTAKERFAPAFIASCLKPFKNVTLVAWPFRTAPVRCILAAPRLAPLGLTLICDSDGVGQNIRGIQA